MHSICPLWQQLACWVAVGTGYFSIFQAAADCARFAFWPQVRATAPCRAAPALPSPSSCSPTPACAHGRPDPATGLHLQTHPQEPLAQDIIGATLMAPALIPYEGWRLQQFNHML
jgi:hypothetical protein